MNEQLYELNSRIDFTLLDPRATFSDVERLCDIAYKNKYRAVCVNPANVLLAKGYIAKNFFNELKVVSVVGFPLGVSLTESKVDELKRVIQDGADEIEFVLNIGKLKEGNFSFIKSEFSKLKKASKGRSLRCFIETCYLDENEIIKISNLCSKQKIGIVTSTGFGTGGADEKSLSKILKEVAGTVDVKACGNIKTREESVKFLNLGASTVGTSRVL